MTPHAAVALLLGTAIGAAPLHAQVVDAMPAERALATRGELEALARGASGDDRARIMTRLSAGDFQPGDRIVLAIDSEPALSDTFVVSTERMLPLPSPVGADIPLAGVLRAELQNHVRTALARYLQHATVRAWPLVRLSIQGEVAHAGIYGVPADAVLSDAVMAAGGTTQDADIGRVRVEREGEPIWTGSLQHLVGAGATVDKAGLRDGDQLVIPRLRETDVRDQLRFAWVLVSLIGGIYGLTRVF